MNRNEEYEGRVKLKWDKAYIGIYLYIMKKIGVDVRIDMKYIILLKHYNFFLLEQLNIKRGSKALKNKT